MNRIDGPMHVNGTLTATTFIAPPASVSGAAIQPGADIDPTKVIQQHVAKVNFCNHATAAAVARWPIHKVQGATGGVVQFGITVTVAAGAACTITIDLLKNGVSILSATFNVDDADAAYSLVEPAGFSSTALVVGDQLDAAITAVSGATLPKGVTAWLTVNEDAVA